MPDTKNLRILLKRRPTGEPKPADFKIVKTPVPSPGPGEMLRRTIYLSLDPYMRGRMAAVKSYADPLELGHVMVGGTVSQVVQSNNPAFAQGDIVLGYDGWQQYAVSSGEGVHKVDPSEAPMSYALGVLGMPGLTAYVGMLDIGQPKAGETVVVSAATGAVGSVAGQIAKLKGCRVVGTAGSDAKCQFAVGELGYDACVNYKTQELLPALREACPNGIDVYFDNVGGAVLEAVLQLINRFARIPLIGLISQYNARKTPPGPNLGPILANRAMIKGMISGDHADRIPDFHRDVSGWLREGRLKYHQTIVHGLENAPQAFIGLFHGENLGKLLVQVSEDPQ